MATGYRIGNQNDPYFVTLTISGWIDVFTRPNYRNIIIESLKYCQQYKGLEIFSYVIMTNHIHLMLRVKEPYELSDMLRDFKKYTSRKILDEIDQPSESRRDWMLGLFRAGGKDQQFKLWKRGNHPLLLDSGWMAHEKLDYIHNNPVKAGWVQNPEDYIYSSARNYAGLDSALEIVEM